uniref:non-specific serine/threonine protein kinase n=1 Tax=Chenopodium quinoa TaxID=63459 RepID=A0A803MTB1_CHEQI
MAIIGSIGVNGLEVVETDSTGRYTRCGEIIGKVDSKTIYKGFDEIEGIEIAWHKTVLTDDIFDNISYLKSVKAEPSLLKSLDHENIIKCYDYWINTESINMITELYTSGSLKDYFETHVHFDIEAIKDFARQILEGNIYVDGSTGRIMIANFGVAMFLEKQYYPVQLVDIYGFGMCFLQMLTGESPYNECCGDVNERSQRIKSGVMPESLSKVTDLQVRHLIEKCLVPTACERPSAVELLNDPLLAPETFTRSKPRLRNSTSITNAIRKFILKFDGEILGTDAGRVAYVEELNGTHRVIG